MLREGFFSRMWDVIFFMKGLKQLFICWYNRRHGRRGTQQEEHFKSVLMASSEVA